MSVTPGPHAFELRFGQHGGAAGGSVIPGSGFGIDLQGRHSTASANFIIPYAYGNDMPEIYTEAEPFFTTTLNGYVEAPSSAVEIEAGTLILPEFVPGLLFGEVSGYTNWVDMLPRPPWISKLPWPTSRQSRTRQHLHPRLQRYHLEPYRPR